MFLSKIKNIPKGLLFLSIIFITSSIIGWYTVFIHQKMLYNIEMLILGTLSCMLFTIVGVGILELKKWARPSAIVLITLKTIQVVFGCARDTQTLLSIHAHLISIYFGIGLTVLFAIIGIASIIYLLSPNIIEEFKN
jgi:hypothetical protein